MSTLEVDGFTQLNDSLDVVGDATIHADAQVDLNLNVDGETTVDTLNAADGVYFMSTLEVDGFTQLNDSLDVAKSAHVQDNFSVEDSTRLNTAGNSGTVWAIQDMDGNNVVTVDIVPMLAQANQSTAVLTVPELIVQDDANYQGDMTVGGALSVTSNITSAAVPSSNSHITNKAYVDGAVASALTPPQMWDYVAYESTSENTIFYINGDLLLYAGEEEGLVNYGMRIFGSDLNQEGTDMEIVEVSLKARGNTHNLNNNSNDLTFNSAGARLTFNIGYSDIKDLSGGQEDGYVSTSVMFETAGGEKYNSGITIRFYLDSENTPPTDATFTTPITGDL